MDPPCPRSRYTWQLLQRTTLTATNLLPLLLKTAFLLALASVKQVHDLQALSVDASCLKFGPNDSKVVLIPRRGCVPKVLSTPFRAQVIRLSALPSTEDQHAPHPLCPVQAPRVYMERSSQFQQSEQLFVGFGGRLKGLPDFLDG